MLTLNPYNNTSANQLRFPVGTKPVFLNPGNDYQNQIIKIPENNMPRYEHPNFHRQIGLVQGLIDIIRNLISNLRTLIGNGPSYTIKKPHMVGRPVLKPYKPSIGDRVISWLSNNETINSWGNNLIHKFESWMPDWLTVKSNTSKSLNTTAIQSNEGNQVTPSFESANEF